MVTPVGCHEQLASFGHIMLGGIPIQGLVDTGVFVSRLVHVTWWHNRAMWGELHPYHQAILGANGKPLPIAGHTWYLHLKWGSATGHMSFVVIMLLVGTPALIDMDFMSITHAHWRHELHRHAPTSAHTLGSLQEDASSKSVSARVSTKTATQTVTNPTISSTSDTIGSALTALLQRLQAPAEFVHFEQVVNPWPNHTVCFEPSLELPLCVLLYPYCVKRTRSMGCAPQSKDGAGLA